MSLDIRHSTLLVILLTLAIPASLEIQPVKAISNASLVTLTITTLPHTPDLPVAIRNGSWCCQVTKTDQSGNATLNVSPENSPYQLYAGTQCQTSSLVVNSSSEACFLMWGDTGNSSSVEEVLLTANTTRLILLQYSGRVELIFADSSSKKVDDSLVDVVRLQGSDGTPYLKYIYKDLWFPENRFQRTSSGIGWRFLDITYTILAVNVTGENVIQSGLYRLLSPHNATWSIKLLLYPFTVTVSDLFFGESVEATVVVTDFTGGFEVGRANTQGGVASFSTFPRGNYLVRTSGSGIGIPSSVVFTGPLDVQSKVFSIADGLSVGSSGLVLGIMILLRRRRRLRRQLSSDASLDRRSQLNDTNRCLDAEGESVNVVSSRGS